MSESSFKPVRNWWRRVDRVWYLDPEVEFPRFLFWKQNFCKPIRIYKFGIIYTRYRVMQLLKGKIDVWYYGTYNFGFTVWRIWRQILVVSCATKCISDISALDKHTECEMFSFQIKVNRSKFLNTNVVKSCKNSTCMY